MRAPVILPIFGTALRAWWDDDAPRLGASLADYTLFAIAPVLLVATAIAGMVFGADAVRGEIVGQLDQLVGHEGARAVQRLLEGASQRRGGVIATVVGSVAYVVAATGAFLELQAALNTIWRVKPHPGMSLKAFVLDRLRSFGLVVAIGFLLLVSLAVTAALAALSGWLSAHAPSIPLVWSGVTVLVSLIVTTGAVRPSISRPARRASALARCDDGRICDRCALHDRPTVHRTLSRSEQRGLQLRRHRIGDDSLVVGVLLLPNPVAQGRVHSRVRDAPGNAARP